MAGKVQNKSQTKYAGQNTKKDRSKLHLILLIQLYDFIRVYKARDKKSIASKRFN
jgi:hypothetical protein